MTAGPATSESASESASPCRLPILAIVVLYGVRAAESRTIRSLRALRRETGGPFPAELMIFDNGGAPMPAENQSFGRSVLTDDFPATYLRSPENVGVAGAYEAGLRQAQAQGLPYLLLLDQDSVLPEGFFDELAVRLALFDSDPTLAALMPRVMAGERQVSPLRGWNKRAALAEGPTRPGELVRAINSGMVLRRSFVERLGGFDQRFWLDGLDHWLCFRIRQAGMRVWCLKSQLDHDLSVARGGAYVSLERYLNILRAEALLYRECLTLGERCRYLASLLFRAAVYPVRWRTFSYSGPSVSQCWKLAGRLAK